MVNISSFLQSKKWRLHKSGYPKVSITKLRTLWSITRPVCDVSQCSVVMVIVFQVRCWAEPRDKTWVMVTRGHTLPPSSSSPPPWQRSVSTRHTAVQVTDKVNIIMRCSAYSVSINIWCGDTWLESLKYPHRKRDHPPLGLHNIVKLRQGSGKDRQGMAVKAKGLKA